MKHADVPFVIDFHTHMLDEELRAICTSDELRMVAAGTAAQLLKIEARSR